MSEQSSSSSPSPPKLSPILTSARDVVEGARTPSPPSLDTVTTPPLPTLSPHFTGLDITPVRPAYQTPSTRSSEKRQRSVSPDTRRKLTSPRTHTPRDRTPKSQDRTPKTRRPGLYQCSYKCRDNTFYSTKASRDRHERSCSFNSKVNIF